MADRVVLTIDGREIGAKQGDRLLWVALDHDIYIPNLCAMREADLPFGGCRLCFVEIDGRRAPVTACSQPVENGMVVYTDTPKVKQLRRTAFELLLSHHHLDCARCPKNKKCELQRIAAHQGFKLKLQRLRRIPRDLPMDSSHPLFSYDPNKCVLCGKCVWVCQRHGVGAIDFASRGLETRISTFDNVPLVQAKCDSCLECVRVCPVGGHWWPKTDKPVRGWADERTDNHFERKRRYAAPAGAAGGVGAERAGRGGQPEGSA